ncbi:MAG: hypothetical protein CMB33_00710 [Euryarchaeota archaeon]|nr:hypothetical protein [Euryarchaeota archaeon]
MSEDFRVLGMSVSRIAILNGVVLSLWGAIAYFVQSSDPPSITALIPAFMGLPMLLLGFLSESNPSNRRHYMHACMIVALMMALGGARVVQGGMSWLAIVSHLLLLQVGVSFTIVGIMSFRHARLQRES